ncbi:MAG: hypothetical protein VB024_10680 [Dysgonamonadaceae bacterium]|nr:hypothetical protein [Dysgonamonadaceae bacterium]
MTKKTKASISEKEAYLLDAYLVNKDVDMFYYLLRGEKSKATDDNLHRQALRYVRTPAVMEYLKERRAVIFSETQKSETVGRFRDKDTVLSALEAEIPFVKGKERAEILLKIADLQQMKQESNKEPEEERVHFYLPLHICKDCPNKGNLVK